MLGIDNMLDRVQARPLVAEFHFATGQRRTDGVPYSRIIDDQLRVLTSVFGSQGLANGSHPHSNVVIDRKARDAVYLGWCPGGRARVESGDSEAAS
jgi:hypothetical protein